MSNTPVPWREKEGGPRGASPRSRNYDMEHPASPPSPSPSPATRPAVNLHSWNHFPDLKKKDFFPSTWSVRLRECPACLQPWLSCGLRLSVKSHRSFLPPSPLFCLSLSRLFSSLFSTEISAHRTLNWKLLVSRRVGAKSMCAYRGGGTTMAWIECVLFSPSLFFFFLRGDRMTFRGPS